jgi:hypothetical protein
MRFCFSLAAMFLVVAGCSRFNESELARARAEAEASRAEALAAKAAFAKEQAQVELKVHSGVIREEQAPPKQAGGGGHGPRITITADGEPFVNQALRDNEEVSSEQLGNYLARLTFASNAKLAIKPDQGNADRAIVKAKFKLAVVDQRTKKTVVTMEFEELRLGRSKSDREQWFLIREGIELIEQAYAEKSKK